MAERKRKPPTKAQKAAAAKKARERRRARRSAPKPTGRPSKIEQELTYTNPNTGREETVRIDELILRQIRVGVPLTYAAQAAGVDRVTVHRWIARGREWIEGGEDPDAAPPKERAYATFATEVVRAKGAAVAYFVAQLHRSAGKGSTRAAIEWLRAQAPEEFKKRIGVELEGGDRKPAPLVPEDQEHYRRAFASAFADKLPELDPGELAPPEDEREEEDG